MLSSPDAFIKAAEKVVRKLPTLAAVSIAIVILAAVIGGTSSLTGGKQFADLLFIAGALKTMSIAIPLALCVFTILMLLYGGILFFYFRFAYQRPNQAMQPTASRRTASPFHD